MVNERKVLVLSDSEGVGNTLKEFLHGTFQVYSGQLYEIEDLARDHRRFEFILLDFILLNDFKITRNEDDYYLHKLAFIREFFPNTKVLLMASQRELKIAGELLNLGYENVLQIPFSKEVVLHRLSIELERERYKTIVDEASHNVTLTKNCLKTNHIDFQAEITKLEKIAGSNSTILITGESGTGKSLLARHIHNLSHRSKHAFLEVHCGAISESLIESELFGHEKGAFTGAIKKKLGKFELADKGTIFLDEIGTISPNVQVKLLQVLQERFIQRVGGDSNINLDIRIIAATNKDLKNSVTTGDFREDLFYRLNVFQIEIPALRDRKCDLESISESLLNKLNKTSSKSIKGLSDEVINIFKAYDWPGNIRELENILERASVLESTDLISVESIPRGLIPGKQGILELSPLLTVHLNLAEARKLSVDAFEKTYLTELLLAHGGRVSAMAEQAEVSVRQLHKLLAKHNIRAKDFALKILE